MKDRIQHKWRPKHDICEIYCNCPLMRSVCHVVADDEQQEEEEVLRVNRRRQRGIAVENAFIS